MKKAAIVQKTKKSLSVLRVLNAIVFIFIALILYFFLLYAPLYSALASPAATGLAKSKMRSFANDCETGRVAVSRVMKNAAEKKGIDVDICIYFSGIVDNWAGAVYYPYDDFEPGNKVPPRINGGWAGINKCMVLGDNWLWCYAT